MIHNGLQYDNQNRQISGTEITFDGTTQEASEVTHTVQTVQITYDAQSGLAVDRLQKISDKSDSLDHEQTVEHGKIEYDFNGQETDFVETTTDNQTPDVTQIVTRRDAVIKNGFLASYNEDTSRQAKTGLLNTADTQEHNLRYNIVGQVIEDTGQEKDIYGNLLENDRKQTYNSVGRVSDIDTTVKHDSTSLVTETHRMNIAYTQRGDLASYVEAQLSSAQPGVITTIAWQAQGGEREGYNSSGQLAGYKQTETRQGSTLNQTIQTTRSDLDYTETGLLSSYNEVQNDSASPSLRQNIHWEIVSYDGAAEQVAYNLTTHRVNIGTNGQADGASLDDTVTQSVTGQVFNRLGQVTDTTMTSVETSGSNLNVTTSEHRSAIEYDNRFNVQTNYTLTATDAYGQPTVTNRTLATLNAVGQLSSYTDSVIDPGFSAVNRQIVWSNATYNREGQLTGSHKVETTFQSPNLPRETIVTDQTKILYNANGTQSSYHQTVDDTWSDGARTQQITDRTGILNNALGQLSQWDESGQTITLQDGLVLRNVATSTNWRAGSGGQIGYAQNGRLAAYHQDITSQSLIDNLQTEQVTDWSGAQFNRQGSVIKYDQQVNTIGSTQQRLDVPMDWSALSALQRAQYLSGLTFVLPDGSVVSWNNLPTLARVDLVNVGRTDKITPGQETVLQNMVVLTLLNSKVSTSRRETLDSDGNAIAMYDARGFIQSYTDTTIDNGLKTSRVWKAVSIAETGYQRGLATEVTEATTGAAGDVTNSDRSNIQYDLHNRVLSYHEVLTTPKTTNVATTQDVSFKYDALGRLTDQDKTAHDESPDKTLDRWTTTLLRGITYDRFDRQQGYDQISYDGQLINGTLRWDNLLGAGAALSDSQRQDAVNGRSVANQVITINLLDGITYDMAGRQSGFINLQRQAGQTVDATNATSTLETWNSVVRSGTLYYGSGESAGLVGGYTELSRTAGSQLDTLTKTRGVQYYTPSQNLEKDSCWDNAKAWPRRPRSKVKRRTTRRWIAR